jgi:hypothetical protein
MTPQSGTFSANGTGSSFKVYGEVHLHINGTWGGGTFSLEYLASDGNWRTIVNTTLTADADKEIRFKSPVFVRPVLSGATGPSLFWEVR